MNNSNKNFQSWIVNNVDCWMQTQNKDQLFEMVKVLKTTPEKRTASIMPEVSGAQEQVVSYDRLYQKGQTSATKDFDDMTDMSKLNEAEILNNLKVRYKRDEIFTYIGPTLIAMNPYKKLPNSYNPQVIEQILKTARAQTDQKFIPHTYSISALAFNQLFENQKNQAIVISGESGAGKTENAQSAMQFLTDLTSDEDESMIKISQGVKAPQLDDINQFSIEAKILACNPILQAFGNSKTVRNDNSSRFGKYMQIYINKVTKKIEGSSICNYLLEKSRLPTQAKGERNYHIFYHFLKGLTESQVKEFFPSKEKMGPKDFNYLQFSECYEIENMDDAQMMRDVLDSFRRMNFNQEEIHTILKLIASLLLLGNLEFDASKADENNPCVIKNKDFLEKVSQLMEVNSKNLEEAFLYKVRVVGGSKIQSPVFQKEDCEGTRESLSQSLYEGLFNWLVQRLNQRLLPTIDPKQQCLMIGLLDIFGFENFKENSFEQLCINFTNEKLQQLYVSYIFKQEEVEYQKDGLEDLIKEIQYDDNQSIIDLIEQRPQGILLLLDEQTNLQSGTDEAYLQKIKKAHDGTNASFKANKISQTQFSIIHTAKEVQYLVSGFRAQNKDEINTQLCEAMNDSKNVIIQDLILPQAAGSGGKFLGSKFRSQLNDLMNELYSCNVHFIRCIKPNELKRKDFIIQSFVFLQVRYLGLLDSIKVRLYGYPHRYPFDEFYSKYHVLHPELRSLPLAKIEKEKKVDLVKELRDKFLPFFFSKDEQGVAFGKTKVYFQNGPLDVLNSKFKDYQAFRKKMVAQIEKNWRRYWLRKMFKKAIAQILQQIVQCQKAFRGYKARQKFIRSRRSVQMIRAFLGRKIASKVLGRLQKNVMASKIRALVHHTQTSILSRKFKVIKDYVKDLIQKEREELAQKDQALRQQLELEAAERQRKEDEQKERIEKEEMQRQLEEAQEAADKQAEIAQIYAQQQQKKSDQEHRKIEVEKQKDEIQSTYNPSITVTTKFEETQETSSTSNSNNPPSRPSTRQPVRTSVATENVSNNMTFLAIPTLSQSAVSPHDTNRKSVSALPRNSRNSSTIDGNAIVGRETRLQSSTSSSPSSSSKLEEIQGQTITRYSVLAKRGLNLNLTDKSGGVPLILRITEYSAIDFEIETEIAFDDIPQSSDCLFQWQNLDKELMDTVKARSFQIIIPLILAQRTKWGSSIPPEQIMIHQNQHIQAPLTNIKVLEKTLQEVKNPQSQEKIRSLTFCSQFPAQQQLDHQKGSLMVPKAPSRASSRPSLLFQRTSIFPFTIENNQVFTNAPSEFEKLSLSDMAVRVNKLILQYTGERKSRYDDPKNLMKLLKICLECDQHPEIAEEIYLQLIKQLTNTPESVHPIPGSKDKNAVFKDNKLQMKYWELLAIISSVMIPSERFFFFLLNWLYEKNLEAVEQNKSDEIRKFTKFIFMRIFKSNMVQRTYLPSSIEIDMIRSMKFMIIQIYFFTGSYILIPIESYTTIGDIQKSLLGRLGMSSRSEYYGIIEVREVNGQVKERFIEEEEKVFDIIGFWDDCREIVTASSDPQFDQDQKNAIASVRLRFYLGIRIFYTFFENDIQSISLVYSQMYWQVHQNQFVINDDDVSNLAALQMVIENVIPDDIQTKQVVWYVQRYVPIQFYSGYEEKQIFNWWYKIKESYTKLKTRTPAAAQLNYLLYLRKQPLFMCTQFPDVRYHSKKETDRPIGEIIITQIQKEDIIFAINGSNIIVCEARPPYRAKQKIPLKNIVRWGILHTEIALMSTDGVRHFFGSDRVNEMAFLIQNYLQIYNETREDRQD